MNRQSMRVAGFCNIISGLMVSSYSIIYLLISAWGRPENGGFSLKNIDWSTIHVPSLLPLIVGIFILVTGCFALSGRKWKLAFIGSIIALPVFIFGAAACMSLVWARDDWPKTTRFLVLGILGFLGLVLLGAWMFLAYFL